MSLVLLLIRHGETAWNAEGRFRGHIDVVLNQNGVKQAQALADAASPLLSTSSIYSSPLQRCLATAEPLARRLGIPIRTDARLLDLHFGDWSGKLRDEVAETYPAEYELWATGDLTLQIPNGGSVQDACGRLQSFLGEVSELHPEDTVAIVTHEIMCQLGTCILLQRPLSEYPAARHDNGAFSVFRLDGGVAEAVGINQRPAIPAA
ncbi:MAG TPA: histidine phosphatase family protein [Dehalococcoidia bacterium]|nr:histidine phosphatase family protein [Dehalococcoidia bacterium]